MLTDVHRITPRARVAFGHSASSRVIRPLGASSLNTRHRQQTRAFRFDIWSSHHDPEFQRNIRRRQQTMRHRFTDSLIRKLSWDRHPFAKDPRDALKRIMEKHSLYGASLSRSKFIDPDSPFTFDGNPRKSDATDGHSQSSSQQFPWFHSPLKSQIDDIFNQWTKNAVKGTRQANTDFISSKSQAKGEARSQGTTTKEAQEIDDYVFDPITNRKIPRDVYESLNAEHEGPVRSFKSYRSQFAHFAPPESEVDRPVVHSDGPPPADELRKYGQVNIDPNPAGMDSSIQDATKVAPEELKAYEFPTTQSEEYSLNHLPPDEPNETYDDLHKYKPYTHNEGVGSLEQDTPKYDDLHKYKPYMYNEDVAVEDNANKYNDLDKYGPYMYREDVKTEDSSPVYDDLDKYGPFMYKEDMKTDDSLPKYDDLDKYNPTKFDDPTSTASEPFSLYGDLDKYKMYRYQEPDGKQAAERDVVAESLKEYDAKIDNSESNDSRPSIAERLQKLDLNGAEGADQLLKTDLPKVETTSREDLELAMDNNREASDAADREAVASLQELRSKQEDEVNQVTKPTMTGNYVRDFPEEFIKSWGFPTQSFQPTTTEVQSGSDTASRLETALERQNNATTNTRPGRQAREEAAETDPYSKEPQGLETSYAEECEGKPTWPTQAREAAAEPDPYSKEPQGLETSYAEECGGKPTWPTFVKTYSTANKDTDAEEAKSPMPKMILAGFPKMKFIKQKEAAATAADSTATTAASEREPTVYKILAYDPTTEKITTAETTSVIPDDAAPLTPAEVLLRLSNPTRFLPHFAPLQAEGFEIASGAGDVLVFRKVRERYHDAQPPVNPIDMMGRPAPLPSAAAFVSPTGFLNYDLPSPSTTATATATAAEEGEVGTTGTTTATTTAPAAATDPRPISDSASTSPPGIENTNFVKREEPVFSGTMKRAEGVAALEAVASRLHKEQAKAKKERKEKAGVGRRMLVAGAWAAGISYTLGVVGDYFVTGGVDGKGPVGL